MGFFSYISNILIIPYKRITLIITTEEMFFERISPNTSPVNSPSKLNSVYQIGIRLSTCINTQEKKKRKNLFTPPNKTPFISVRLISFVPHSQHNYNWTARSPDFLPFSVVLDGSHRIPHLNCKSRRKIPRGRGGPDSNKH